MQALHHALQGVGTPHEGMYCVPPCAHHAVPCTQGRRNDIKHVRPLPNAMQRHHSSTVIKSNLCSLSSSMLYVSLLTDSIGS
jgi:hypothetical protein